MTHSFLEPVYVLSVIDYAKNETHIVTNMRNVTFLNMGNVPVLIAGKILVPGETWLIDTDGILTQRFALSFMDKGIINPLPHLQAHTTWKRGYKEIQYPIING